MHLFLIRHGQSQANAEERAEGWGSSPLSELGRQQAQAVAQRLAELNPFTALYTSPLRRALETAQIISLAVGLPPILLDGLREINIGKLDGVPFSRIRTRYAHLGLRWIADDPTLRFPGGETPREHRERALRTLNEVIARHPGADERVIVVSHGGTLATFLLHHGIGDEKNRWLLARALGNCAITHLEVRKGQVHVWRFNDQEHLNL